MNFEHDNRHSHDSAKPVLKRSLTTTHMVFYGLGVTVGAGIYVLIGQAAGRAGVYAPFSFFLAGLVMAFSAASFAELATRYPVSAGEAAYVEAGLGSKTLSIFVGLAVILVGITSAATVSVGSTGYVREFIDLPTGIIIAAMVLSLGLISAWGITESVSLAALFALIEVGGLVFLIIMGFLNEPQLVDRFGEVIPTNFDFAVWSGIAGAGLLAFFAFIGFEDMVNVAEEVKSPETTLPLSIFLTLVISTAIYILVAAIAVLSGPVSELAASSAPLAVVIDRLTNLPSATLSAVAIIAGLNGIIVQIIMGSRVLYGLSSKGDLPQIFAQVHPLTRTPLIATAVVVGSVLILALTFPIESLAEMTSRITLVVFALVNLSLLGLKFKNVEAPDKAFTVWTIVPALGLFLCLFVFVVSLV